MAVQPEKGQQQQRYEAATDRQGGDQCRKGEGAAMINPEDILDMTSLSRDEIAAVAEHEQMVAALKKRDGTALARVLQLHLDKTLERVRDQI